MKKLIILFLLIGQILNAQTFEKPVYFKDKVNAYKYISVTDSMKAGYLVLPSKSTYPLLARTNTIINYNGTLEYYNGSTWVSLMGYTLPDASTTVKGGVKIGLYVSMTGDSIGVDTTSLKTWLLSQTVGSANKLQGTWDTTTIKQRLHNAATVGFGLNAPSIQYFVVDTLEISTKNYADSIADKVTTKADTSLLNDTAYAIRQTVNGKQDSLGTLTANQIVVGNGVNAVKNSGIGITALNKLYLLGNSITANPIYCRKLNTLLPSSIKAVNVGISGDNTTQILSRLNDDILANNDAAYTVILAGINDIFQLENATFICNNLQNIYTQLHNHGIIVIPLTILPCNLLNASQQSVLDSVNLWIKNTAINVDHVIDVYKVFEDPDNLTKYLPIYNYDNIHPSELGYVKLAETVYDSITWNYIPNINNGYSVNLLDSIALDQSVSKTSCPTFGAIKLSNYDDTVNTSVVDIDANTTVKQSDYTSSGYSLALTNTHYGFKIQAIDDLTLGSVILQLKRVGTITNSGVIKVKIFSDNSGTPNTLLYTTSEINCLNTTTSFANYYFSTNMALIKDTYYWIVINIEDAPVGGTVYINYNNTALTTCNTVTPISSDWTVGTGKCYYKLISKAIEGARIVSDNNNAIIGTSITGVGVWGVSTNSYGVNGTSTNSIALKGTSTNSYGVSGTSTNGIALNGLSTNSIGIKGTSTNSYGGVIYQSGVLSANNSNNALLIRRYNSGTYNVTGTLLQITDNPTNSGTISGSAISAQIDATERLRFNPRVVDGATAVGAFIDTKNSLSNAGASLLDIRNSGTNKFRFGATGNYFGILETYNYYNATLGTNATNDKSTLASSTGFNWYNYNGSAWTPIANLSNTGRMTLAGGLRLPQDSLIIAGTDTLLKTNGSASRLTNFPTLNQNTTGTAAGLTAQYIDWNSASGGSSIKNKPTILTTENVGAQIHDSLVNAGTSINASNGITLLDDTVKLGGDYTGNINIGSDNGYLYDYKNSTLSLGAYKDSIAYFYGKIDAIGKFKIFGDSISYTTNSGGGQSIQSWCYSPYGGYLKFAGHKPFVIQPYLRTIYYDGFKGFVYKKENDDGIFTTNFFTLSNQLVNKHYVDTMLSVIRPTPYDTLSSTATVITYNAAVNPYRTDTIGENHTYHINGAVNGSKGQLNVTITSTATLTFPAGILADGQTFASLVAGVYNICWEKIQNTFNYNIKKYNTYTP